MGVYESEYWLSSGWGMNRRETQSGTYHPYLPDALSSLSISLNAHAASAVAKGEASIRLLDERSRYLTDTEPLARLMLRSEAMASSRIEGLQVSAGRLLECEALDELGVPHRLDSAEAAVMANISLMRDAVASVSRMPRITVDALCDINRLLLQGSAVAERAGRLRTEQNWIGGNNVNPIGAAYVPPRPEHVPSLMDDLVSFCNLSPLPALAKAALAHAQLETIHPFVDGNGRTGRALIHIVLRRGGLSVRVTPPISLVLATDKARYINNLAAFRTEVDAGGCDAAAEAANDWIEYFANACILACERAEGFERRLASIQDAWRQRRAFRKGSSASLLIGKLLGNPVVSVASAARLTGRSQEAARLAIHSLEGAGILVQNAKNRKSGIYVAREVVDAFTEYERALATPGGDTAAAQPVRPVPPRVLRERR